MGQFYLQEIILANSLCLLSTIYRYIYSTWQDANLAFEWQNNDVFAFEWQNNDVFKPSDYRYWIYESFLEILSQLANICPRENMLGAVYIEKNNLNNNNKTNKTYGSLPLNCFMAQKLATNQT